MTPETRFKVCVIGIGNFMRGDDAVGLKVIGKLREVDPDAAEYFEQNGEPTSLLDCLEKAETAILVDAVQGNQKPGHLYRWVFGRDELTNKNSISSSHSMGVRECLELGRALDKLPDQVILYGIEAVHFDLGKALSSPVASAVEPAAKKILSEIRSFF